MYASREGADLHRRCVRHGSEDSPYTMLRVARTLTPPLERAIEAQPWRRNATATGRSPFGNQIKQQGYRPGSESGPSFPGRRL